MGRPQYEFSKVVTATPTISASPDYSSGDLIGTLMTFAAASDNARLGSIESVLLTDLAAQNAAIDVIFFDSNPDATTFTDNAALDIADADLTRICAIVKLAAADYSAFADNSAVQVGAQGRKFALNGSEILYACLVSRGAPNYASTSDLKLTVGLHLD